MKVCGLHRLSNEWKYDEYFVEAQLFHGSRHVGPKVYSSHIKVNEHPRFYDKVVFNDWLVL